MRECTIHQTGSLKSRERMEHARKNKETEVGTARRKEMGGKIKKYFESGHTDLC
jgi:hypothetical protein